MKIKKTKHFQKSFNRLPEVQKKKTEKQLALFFKSMFHASLHTEKLQPHYKNIWSFRVDLKYRVIFTFVPSKDELWLLAIGPHDIYKKHA